MHDPNVRPANNTASTVMSIFALVLSAIALLGTGFNAYQLFSLRQAIGSGNAVGGTAAPAPPAPPATTAEAPAPAGTEAPAGTVPTETTAPVSAVQPGQFVRPAFNNIAEVELLSVSRNPQNPNLVSVQARVRLLDPDKASATDQIFMNQTKARNSQTSEVYEANREGSSSSANLFLMRPAPNRPDEQNSADVSVQLEIPSGVTAIDLYIPETEAFTNVPIASS